MKPLKIRAEDFIVACISGIMKEKKGGFKMLKDIGRGEMELLPYGGMNRSVRAFVIVGTQSDDT